MEVKCCLQRHWGTLIPVEAQSQTLTPYHFLKYSETHNNPLVQQEFSVLQRYADRRHSIKAQGT